MSFAPDFQPDRELRLPQGTLRYRDLGAGSPIVFVHGGVVNGALWREVAPPLAERFRCLVPDLPLGGWGTGTSLILSGIVLLALLVVSHRRVQARRHPRS